MWNGGNCGGNRLPKEVDDVAFVSALLDDLIGSYAVDPQRIYATGISNGAVMTYRLAAELSDRIAAIAPVSGSMGTDLGAPKRPLSVVHFHGTLDEYVPFLGGVGKKSISGTPYWPVSHSIRAWVKANGCDEHPKVEVLSKSGDELEVTRNTHAAGNEGSEVVLVTIEGGGHTWPGMKPPAKTLGKSTLSISANDLMWEFFEKHPMT
jgi:polyhydroxybutyrate depolymerase